MCAVSGGIGLTGFSTPASVTQEPVETFEFLGRTSGWVGVSPSEIEDVQNPTLTLEAGETYQIFWDNDDGATHNFHIIDRNGETIIQTDIITSGSQEFTFESTETLAGGKYQCDPHAGRMNGDIEIEGIEPPDSNDGEDDGDTDDGDTDDGDTDDGTDGSDGTDDGTSDGDETDNGGNGSDDSGGDGGTDSTADEDSADDGGPGFGLPTAIAALGAGAGAMKRYIGNVGDE